MATGLVSSSSLRFNPMHMLLSLLLAVVPRMREWTQVVEYLSTSGLAIQLGLVQVFHCLFWLHLLSGVSVRAVCCSSPTGSLLAVAAEVFAVAGLGVRRW